MNPEVNGWMQKLLDGSISQGEFALLQDEMERDAEVRQLYYEYAMLEQGLQFRLTRKAQQAGISGLAEARLRVQRKKTLKWAALTAVAATILLAIGLQFFFIHQAPAELQYASSPGTRYTVTHAEGTAVDGDKMQVGSRMMVSQGTVELNFDSGVRAVISSPADITMLEEGVLQMDEGHGWFDVPAKAVGFTVVTKDLEVVDLGTRFGVHSSPDSEDQVHVFQGRVKVMARNSQRKETTLSVDEAVTVLSNGVLRPIKNDGETFLSELPNSLPHLHFSFDEANDFLTENTLTGPEGLSYIYHGDSPDLEEGVFGNCLRMDGKANYLESDWMGILGNRPRSVAFWIKMPEKRVTDRETHRSDTIVGWGMQRDENETEMLFSSKWTVHMDYSSYRHPILNISFGGFWYHAPETVLDDDKWHHLVVTYSGKSDDEGYPRVKFYVDGVLSAIKSKRESRPVARTTDGTVIIDTLEKTPFVIGASLSSAPNTETIKGQYLRAMIDELYVIEGEIDQQAVDDLMHANRYGDPVEN